MTLGNHISRLKGYGLVYVPSLKFSDQLLALSIQWARDQAWQARMGTHEHDIRKSAVLDDGDPLPEDFALDARRAYYTLSGTVTPLTYTPVKNLPGLLSNTAEKGLATHPYYWLSDQKFNCTPTLTNVTYWYYYRPGTLLVYDNDGNLIMTTDDEMDVSAMDEITCGAFFRMLDVTEAEPDALKINQEQMAELRSGREAFYAMAARELNVNFRKEGGD